MTPTGVPCPHANNKQDNKSGRSHYTALQPLPARLGGHRGVKSHIYMETSPLIEMDIDVAWILSSDVTSSSEFLTVLGT